MIEVLECLKKVKPQMHIKLHSTQPVKNSGSHCYRYKTNKNNNSSTFLGSSKQRGIFLSGIHDLKGIMSNFCLPFN